MNKTQPLQPDQTQSDEQLKKQPNYKPLPDDMSLSDENLKKLQSQLSGEEHMESKKVSDIREREKFRKGLQFHLRLKHIFLYHKICCSNYILFTYNLGQGSSRALIKKSRRTCQRQRRFPRRIQG
ncbi:hypothetical protein FGO68_gene5383 [Halteria grandinella]|uniref:Uncharacterized protein n=1 Tax=Halteria grandinella TaxID=5974 RepID=A0A8J8TAF5_HALGN|nr:hypothetical protein FGO68_gene5383 [Halteria grandinella]